LSYIVNCIDKQVKDIFKNNIKKDLLWADWEVEQEMQFMKAEERSLLRGLLESIVEVG
jgi:hypothetical protein